MKKLNIDNLVKKVLEESLQEKADDLVKKIKSKVNEWNPNGPVNISGQPSDMHEDEDKSTCEYHMEKFGPEDERTKEFCKGEMTEKLHGKQSKIDVAEPKGKITAADFKKLRGEVEEGSMCEQCGGNMVEDVCEQCGSGNMGEEMEEGNAFTGALAKAKETGKDNFEVDGKKYNVKETKKNNDVLRLTENEMIDLIEKIVLEQKKAKGMSETEKVLSADKKENEKAIKDVTKKMKEYLKDMSKGSFEPNPEDFPKGNGSLEKDAKVKKYTPSDAVDEYIDAFSYPGMTNLVYDEIKPNDDLINKYLTGDSTTGNAQTDKKGKALGNVVPSNVGKKFKKNFDENLYGQEQMNASYKRQPQPIDQAGETTERGSLKSKKGKKTAQSVLNAVDESTEKVNVILNEEFTKMKHLIGYNKNTQ